MRGTVAKKIRKIARKLTKVHEVPEPKLTKSNTPDGKVYSNSIETFKYPDYSYRACLREIKKLFKYDKPAYNDLVEKFI